MSSRHRTLSSSSLRDRGCAIQNMAIRNQGSGPRPDQQQCCYEHVETTHDEAACSVSDATDHQDKRVNAGNRYADGRTLLFSHRYPLEQSPTSKYSPHGAYEGIG